MTLTTKRNHTQRFPLEKASLPAAAAGQSNLAYRFILIWVIGTVILLPVNIFNLPLNMTMVDFWVIGTMPVLWFFIIRGKLPVSMSYFIAMWVIFLASFASTFVATNPTNSLVVIAKEVYVFVWFISLVAALPKLNQRDHRRWMLVWAGVVLLHGLLIIAQFFSPSLWRSISGFTRSAASYEIYRPSGLFLCDTAGCANRAAYFQLLGFVPVMLAGLSKPKTAALALVVLLSILATGSMGATLAGIFGLVTSIVVLAIIRKQLGLIFRYFLRLLVVATLFGGIFYVVISQSERYQVHFKSIVVGRAERSSGGRFALWSRGLNVLVSRQIGLWGIGPNNFRVIDWQGKQLHNDFLAFLVERGLIGAFGLVLVAFIAVTKALNLLLFNRKNKGSVEVFDVIFLAAVMATLFESLTHQIFHDRQLWFVLALLEATLYRKSLSMAVEKTSPVHEEAPVHGQELVLQQ